MKSPKCQNRGRCAHTHIINCSYGTKKVSGSALPAALVNARLANPHPNVNPVALQPHLMEIHDATVTFSGLTRLLSGRVPLATGLHFTELGRHEQVFSAVPTNSKLAIQLGLLARIELGNRGPCALKDVGDLRLTVVARH
jgi:hypothetical protein